MFKKNIGDKMKKEKAITSDLFAVDTCDHCNGEGQIEVKDDITEKMKKEKAITSDLFCDICNGSGILL